MFRQPVLDGATINLFDCFFLADIRSKTPHDFLLSTPLGTKYHYDACKVDAFGFIGTKPLCLANGYQILIGDHNVTHMYKMANVLYYEPIIYIRRLW